MDHRFHDHGGVKKFRVRTVKKQQAQVERRTNSVIGHFLGSRDQRRGEGKSGEARGRTTTKTAPAEAGMEKKTTRLLQSVMRLGF